MQDYYEAKVVYMIAIIIKEGGTGGKKKGGYYMTGISRDRKRLMYIVTIVLFQFIHVT